MDEGKDLLLRHSGTGKLSCCTILCLPNDYAMDIFYDSSK